MKKFAITLRLGGRGGGSLVVEIVLEDRNRFGLDSLRILTVRGEGSGGGVSVKGVLLLKEQKKNCAIPWLSQHLERRLFSKMLLNIRIYITPRIKW